MPVGGIKACSKAPFNDESPLAQPEDGVLLRAFFCLKIGETMHYYKRDIGKYAKKCGKLSMLQHGAYTLLMDACYDREQFPTEQEAINWCWAVEGAEVDAVKFILSRFFVLDAGVYVQKQIIEELEKYKKFCQLNKDKAKTRENTRRFVKGVLKETDEQF